MFITVEGIAGAGKSTFAKILVNRIRLKYNKKIVYTSEPTMSKYGILVKSKSIHSNKSTIAKEKVIYAVKDRDEHLKNELNDMLEDNDIVICEGYVDSDIANYGAYGLQVDTIKELNRWFKKPDIVIYLDIDIDTAIKRNRKLDTPNKRWLLERSRLIYKNLSLNSNNYITVDGNMKTDKLVKSMIKILKSRGVL